MREEWPWNSKKLEGFKALAGKAFSEITERQFYPRNRQFKDLLERKISYLKDNEEYARMADSVTAYSDRWVWNGNRVWNAPRERGPDSPRE